MRDGASAGVSRVALCRADDVGDGEGRGFRLGAGTAQVAIVVIRWRGSWRAYVNSCPHVGTPLDWVPDRFFDRTGALLLCGTHGALFRPDDGVCVAGPCVGHRLAPVALSIENGALVVALA